MRVFGTAPTTILTDNDLHMGDAIHSTLTTNYGIKHGLCIWHLLKNIRSNMTAKLGGEKYKQFHADLMKCLDHCINCDEFEQLWTHILESDDYAGARSYLSRLNGWRERWAPVCF